MKKLLAMLAVVILVSSASAQTFAMGGSGVSDDTYTPGGAYNPSGTSGTQQGEVGEVEVIDLGHRCAFVGEEFIFPLGGAWSVESGVTLPQGASFDYATGVFTWTPQQADIGTTCHLVFRLCVASEDITAEVDISAVNRVNIKTTFEGFAGSISMDEYSGGKKIVWTEYYPGIGQQVFLYDIPTMTKTKITDEKYYRNYTCSKIYGDNIVWRMTDARIGLSELQVYNIATGSVTPFATAGKYYVISGDDPVIYQNKIAYIGELRFEGQCPENYNYKDIYLYNISTGETSYLTVDKAFQISPCIWGDYVVWEDDRNGIDNADIYIYTISTKQEKQLTSVGYQRSPAVWGDKVVWFDKRNYPSGDDYSNPICPIAKWDIYAYDISGAYGSAQIKVTDKPLSVAMSGGMWLSVYKGKVAVLYSAGRFSEGNEVTHLYNLDVYDIATKKMVRILQQTANVSGPAICENKVAWIENESFIKGKFVRIADLPDFIPPTPPVLNIQSGCPWTNNTTQVKATGSSYGNVSDIKYRITEGSVNSSVPVVNWTAIPVWFDPRGGCYCYTFTAEGLNLKHGKDYYISVKAINGAGLESDVTSVKITVDTTLPTTPIVSDDGEYTSNTKILNASWTASSDPESGGVRYWYAIGTSKGGVDIRDFSQQTFCGTNTSVIANNIYLQNGKTYYISIKARNGAGGECTSCSDGITVDTTKPSMPVVSDKGTSTPSYTQLTASWSVASDSESKIKEYQYVVGTIEELKEAISKNLWKSAGNKTSISVTGLSLIPGKTYYFAVKAINGAGMSSDVSSQKKGITVIRDKTAPKITHTPITSAKKNRAISFTAVVKDAGSGLQTVTLYWRKEIKKNAWSDLRSLVMTLQKDGSYKADLTASQVEDRQIKYYISANDKAGNTAETKKYTIKRN